MSTTTIDLQQFCVSEASAHHGMLGHPFRRGEYVYATNLHICVRVPADTGYDAPAQDHPDVLRLGWKDGPDPSRDKPWPGQAYVSGAGDCPRCDRLGVDPDGVKCRECGGVGETWQPLYITVGDNRVLPYLDRLIRTLPNVRYYADTFPGDPIYFTFDGDGEGLVMPMAREVNH